LKNIFKGIRKGGTEKGLVDLIPMRLVESLLVHQKKA